MSNDDVEFSQTETTPQALDDPEKTSNGGFDKLPESVQAALSRDGIDNLWDKATDPLGPRTDNAGEVSAISDIVRDGDTTLQTGTKLDDAMLDWSRETLHDRQGPSIFENVGVTDDYAHYAAARDDALASVFDAAGRDHQAVSAELASDTGQQFLTDLHTHVWADTPNTTENQQSTHSLLAWIGDEANSGDPEIAGRAGVAAHALAVNLDANHELYLHPPGSPLGTTPNAANLNPALMSADAVALAPYQDALVGETRGTAGFKPLDNIGAGNLEHARNVFAVIDSDPGAAGIFNGAATEKVLSHQQAFASVAEVGPRVDTDAGDLKRSALLLGVMTGGAEQEATARGLQDDETNQAIFDIKKAGLDALLGKPFGADDLPYFEQARDTIETAILGADPAPEIPTPNTTPPSSQSMVNHTFYQLAVGLDVEPEATGIPAQYFDGAVLKSPDQIPREEWDGYSTALQNYLYRQGYVGIGEMFDRFYEDGAGK